MSYEDYQKEKAERDLPPTARDMFAAYALPAIAAAMDIRRAADVAVLAYTIADAMMAERKRAK